MITLTINSKHFDSLQKEIDKASGDKIAVKVTDSLKLIWLGQVCKVMIENGYMPVFDYVTQDHIVFEKQQ